MRNLASIQRVLEIRPVPNAERVELITVLGWHVVVQKGEFNVGDLCVYCEIDSLLPERPEFEFLRKNGFRIRTLRLRGAISQGICFPLTIIGKIDKIFPGGDVNVQVDDDGNLMSLVEGMDVTELLGITKYEPPEPACLGGDAKGKFPPFLVKSDETRVQVLQVLLDKYNGVKCYYTEKVDGSSYTCYLNNNEFGVCSRNLELNETENNSLWKLTRKFDIENKLRKFGKNLSLQGEIYGEGIQKNKYKIKGQNIRFFNVFDIDEQCYYNFNEFVDFIGSLGLETVPVLNTEYVLSNNIDELVELSKGNSVLNPDSPREGIVIRPLVELQDFDITILNDFDLINGRVSFKAINPEFLLKYGE
jgi:RNA ligase (TIGR02306 family)